jgi:WD40 repeat protein
MLKNQINSIFTRSNATIDLESKESVIDVNSQLQSIILSPGSDKVLICIHNNKPQIWDIKTEKLLLTLNVNNITSASWSPDGNQIVMANNKDKNAIIWDSLTGLFNNNIKVENNIMSVSWSPKGNAIAIGTQVDFGKGTLSIWMKNPAGLWIRSNNYPNDEAINCISWNNLSNKVVYGSFEGSVKIIDIFAKTMFGYPVPPILLIKERAIINLLEWTKDGTKIACCRQSAGSIIWNIDIAKQTYIRTDIKVKSGKSLSWAPDNKSIVFGTDDANVCILNTLTGKIVKKTAMAPVNSVGWTNNGLYILYNEVLEGSNRLSIWDLFGIKTGGKNKLKKTRKSKKMIDNYKKVDLIKIAKKQGVSLRTRNKTVKTKLELYNSLKRKQLI